MVSIEGTLMFANRAFSKLVGVDIDKGVDGLAVTDTALATFVPGLMRAVQKCHAEGKPSERRAKVYRGTDKPPLELAIWLSPLPVPGYEVHLLVRVEELDPRNEERSK
jgi:hypothetical protein